MWWKKSFKKVSDIYVKAGVAESSDRGFDPAWRLGGLAFQLAPFGIGSILTASK
jgi:hypothetical protein